MKVRTLAVAFTLVSLLLIGAGSALGHQPVLIDSEATEVVLRQAVRRAPHVSN
jgi:hypothetical protein